MNKLYNDTAVQAIANAIRAKNGSSDTYTIGEMSTALNDLSYYAKPTIENVPLATFEADGLPLNSLKVSVEAKQEGSGVPSPENVRPISGWNEVQISDMGVLQLMEATQDSYTANGIEIRYIGSGKYKVSGTAIDSTNVVLDMPIIPITIYDGDDSMISFNNSYASASLGLVLYNGTMIVEQWSLNSANRVASYSAMRGKLINDIKLSFTAISGSTYDFTFQPILYGSNSTRGYTISLPQTVYGAEVDVVNGVLKITDGYIASYNGETLPSTWISSMDEYVEGTTPTTGAEVCYELANPIIINLTPTLIKSLNGTNNLSVDCGDVIELEYFKEV